MTLERTPLVPTDISAARASLQHLVRRAFGKSVSDLRGERDAAACEGAAALRQQSARFIAELVVEALEPNARIAYQMTTPMWSGHIEYAITDKHRSTSVSILFVPDQPKRGARLTAQVAKLTRPLMQWRLRSRLAALRRVVEANV